MDRAGCIVMVAFLMGIPLSWDAQATDNQLTSSGQPSLDSIDIKKSDLKNIKMLGTDHDRIIVTLINHQEKQYRFVPMKMDEVSDLLKQIEGGKTFKIQYKTLPYKNYYHITEFISL